MDVTNFLGADLSDVVVPATGVLNVGLVVYPTDYYVVKYLGGLWTANPVSGQYDGGGTNIVAKVGYYFPGAKRGAANSFCRRSE